MPSKDPGSVIPRTSKIMSTTYGNKAVNHTTYKKMYILGNKAKLPSLSIMKPCHLCLCLSIAKNSKLNRQSINTKPCPILMPLSHVFRLIYLIQE